MIVINTLQDMGGSNLNHAANFQQRKANKAGKAYRVWKDTGCDKLMLFQDFKSQATRNHILKGFSRSPLILPWETMPSEPSRSERFRRRNKRMKR